MKDAQIIKKLEDRNLAKVASQIGVTRSWLHAIRSGQVRLSENTRQKLVDYFNANP